MASLNELATVAQLLSQDSDWEAESTALMAAESPRAIHLAVFRQPYLELLLEGRKTVESRFSVVRCAPFERVSSGDLVLLKESGGPVLGICEIGAAWFYKLDSGSLARIRLEFAKAICGENNSFWEKPQRSMYATLMAIRKAKPFEQRITWRKRDRRGWVVLRSPSPLFDQRSTPTVPSGAILAISGGIASGKSTLAEAMASSLRLRHASFGRYVRAEAQRRGTPMERRELQSLGEELVENDVQAFCKAVLREADWQPEEAVVIDGVRHLRVASALKDLAHPAPFVLIHIDADQSTRLARMTSRGDRDGVLNSLDQHSTEVEVADALLQIADLRLDGNRPLDELVQELTTWLTKTLSSKLRDLL